MNGLGFLICLIPCEIFDILVVVACLPLPRALASLRIIFCAVSSCLIFLDS